ncbi:MAG: AMP-dependent synthetase [Acetobacteraceae bacterium]|nr:AMP-dependent synthetase [Acetobacteraceae bacterium]
MDYPADTVLKLLDKGAGPAPAIGTPSTDKGARPWLSHGSLRALARKTITDLNNMGIGRNDRIAMVLPNGPEMAAAFLAVAAGATTAPLNPGYKHEEFAFYLSDLNAKALLIQRGTESPARAVAVEKKIPIIELVPEESGPTGAFTLAPGKLVFGAPAHGGPAEAEDIALVLHTSGTTSRPKIVPLRQINVTASAYHIGRTLLLRPDDVCLNIMPLFHIHGLIAAVLSSVAAGGGVSCTPGYSSSRFFATFDEVKPSWYTAVPTMHQDILGLAPRNAEIIPRGRLRFIRSSSSSLPPQVMTALEAAFGVPVIESYGMTEAAHQMASNPLPPGKRFPGSVGIAAGPDVAIMSEAGDILPAGDLGEVVIRGRNVTAGYENNTSANASAFTDGWFRTGDQGVIDAGGYLRLTGRLKELINRGGEKISPLEVDTVIMDHPSVEQCLTFAMPHDRLGEEVAAAIVLRPGLTATDMELRAFAAQRLAAFKVPRKIIFLAEIPKGATGKLMRIGLADKLGLS